MWLVGMLLAVTLSPPFAEAVATAEASGDEIVLTVTVGVDAEPAPSFVVMHVLLPEDQETHSLAPAGNGLFRGTINLAAVDRAIVFEAGWDSGAYSLSEVTSLVSLGVPNELVGESFDIETLDDDGGSVWAWTAAGATAAAVGALILFAFLPKTSDEPETGREP